MLVELRQTEAWILVLLGQNPVELPLPIKELWAPAAAFNWGLRLLPALENLHLEGWLWFPPAVTHSPQKVTAAFAGSDRQRAAKFRD